MCAARVPHSYGSGSAESGWLSKIRNSCEYVVHTMTAGDGGHGRQLAQSRSLLQSRSRDAVDDAVAL